MANFLSFFKQELIPNTKAAETAINFNFPNVLILNCFLIIIKSFPDMINSPAKM